MKRLMLPALALLVACKEEAPKTDPALTQAVEQLSAKVDQLQPARELPPPGPEFSIVANSEASASTCWVLKKDPNGDMHLAVYRTQGGGELRLVENREITYDLMLQGDDSRRNWSAERIKKAVLEQMERAPSPPEMIRDPRTGTVARAGTRAIFLWHASGDRLRIPMAKTPQGVQWEDDGSVHLIRRETWDDAGKIK